MTSSNGNIFRVTDHLCGEFTGHRWIPRTKAINAELWYFLWSVPWINSWVNNRKAGDLRRNRAHYDVIVMQSAVLLHVEPARTVTHAKPNIDSGPSSTPDQSVYHACTHFREKGVFFSMGGANSRNYAKGAIFQTWVEILKNYKLLHWALSFWVSSTISHSRLSILSEQHFINCLHLYLR